MSTLNHKSDFEITFVEVEVNFAFVALLNEGANVSTSASGEVELVVCVWGLVIPLPYAIDM